MKYHERDELLRTKYTTMLTEKDREIECLKHERDDIRKCRPLLSLKRVGMSNLLLKRLQSFGAEGRYNQIQTQLRSRKMVKMIFELNSLISLLLNGRSKTGHCFSAGKL